jgi:hypothetical protein
LDTNGKNCFGCWLRDKGHNRVPDPPDKITGIMLFTPSSEYDEDKTFKNLSNMLDVGLG